MAVVDGGANPLTTVVLSLSAFALTTIVLEFHHGVHAHGLRRDAREHLPSLLAVFGRNPRRFGGAVAHLGVVLLIVGVALDVTYQRDDRVTLTVGDTVEVDRYTLTFESLDSEITQRRMALSATLGVARTGGSDAGTLVTERYLNVNQDQPRTHVGVRSLLREDVYVILEEVDVDSETATFTVLLHPGLVWLWLGGSLILVGGLLAVLCGRRRRAAEDAVALGGTAAQPVAVGAAGAGGAGRARAGAASGGAVAAADGAQRSEGEVEAPEPRSPDLDGPIEPWEDR
jgi:cytochrome c-type biogenesis protein CcmF